MPELNRIESKGLRLTFGDDTLFVAATGESYEPQTRQRLSQIADLSAALTSADIPHGTFLRKRHDGGHEPDTIVLPL